MVYFPERFQYKSMSAAAARTPDAHLDPEHGGTAAGPARMANDTAADEADALFDDTAVFAHSVSIDEALETAAMLAPVKFEREREDGLMAPPVPASVARFVAKRIDDELRNNDMVERVDMQRAYSGGREDGYYIFIRLLRDPKEPFPPVMHGVPVKSGVPRRGAIMAAGLNVTEILSLGVVTLTTVKYALGILGKYISIGKGDVMIKSDLFEKPISAKQAYAKIKKVWLPKLRGKAQGDEAMTEYQTEQKAKIQLDVAAAAEMLESGKVSEADRDAFLEQNILTPNLLPFLFTSTGEIVEYMASLRISDAMREKFRSVLVMAFTEAALRKAHA
jgi:hypothetical protein